MSGLAPGAETDAVDNAHLLRELATEAVCSVIYGATTKPKALVVS